MKTNTTSRKNFSEKERRRIFEKTSGRCYYCGKQLVFKNRVRGLRGSWHVDHKIPVSRGGTNHVRNLVPACIDCNSDKSDLTASEYFSLYEEEEQGLSWFEKALLAGGAFLLGKWIHDKFKGPRNSW